MPNKLPWDIFAKILAQIKVTLKQFLRHYKNL